MVRQGIYLIIRTYATIEVGTLSPDLVVMDIYMPRMSGVEAAGQIKARYSHIVVVGLSVNEDGATASALRAAERMTSRKT
jgi:DNA-binding NarL/FixJ family response regulator